MDNNGWTAFDIAEPEESACLRGQILIWHIYRGVIAERWERRHDTPMFTHWRRIPKKGWIPAKEREPSQEDGDNMSCVLAWRDGEGFTVTGWHRFGQDRRLTHWMPTPDPPADGAIYRARF